MITYPRLGDNGRLGNQLFQIAATIGTAIDNNTEYAFPRWQYEDNFCLRGCFYDSLPELTDYRESKFSYSPIPRIDNQQLFGYFQSEKYWYKYRDIIRELLAPRHIPRKVYACAIHVRRGDYAGNLHHDVVTNDYYQKACKRIKCQTGIDRFLVFSDDAEWCSRNLDIGFDFEIATGNEISNFSEMISCKHHVICNSSFSWWGAYLGQSTGQVVAAPNRWFGPLGPKDFSDVYIDGWTQIDV